jgi:uncharacterized coiled-coil protein SlyX
MSQPAVVTNTNPHGKTLDERMYNMEIRMDQSMIMLRTMSEQITELVMHARKTPHQMGVNKGRFRPGHTSHNLTMGASSVSHLTSPADIEMFQITVDHSEHAGMC